MQQKGDVNTAWSWIVQHWKAFGITVPALIGAIAWTYSTIKAHRQKRLDTRVLQALGNLSWSSNRPFTGGGESCVSAGEIAELFRLPVAAVADSLERLEARGRVRRTEGDVPPYWFVVRR